MTDPDKTPLASWDEVATLYRPFEEIWEKEEAWRTGRSNLLRIINYWRTHLPKARAAYSHVQVDFQYPTVWDEVSDEQVQTLFIPEVLRNTFMECINQIVKLRWISWEPGFSMLVNGSYLLNTHSLMMVDSIIHNTEQDAIALGMPELWQIGGAVFGLPVREWHYRR